MKKAYSKKKKKKQTYVTAMNNSGYPTTQKGSIVGLIIYLCFTHFKIYTLIRDRRKFNTYFISNKYVLYVL